jgi:hypothetical protein
MTLDESPDTVVYESEPEAATRLLLGGGYRKRFFNSVEPVEYDPAAWPALCRVMQSSDRGSLFCHWRMSKGGSSGLARRRIWPRHASWHPAAPARVPDP